MRTGRIQFPLNYAEELIAVRNGAIDKHEFLRISEELMAKLDGSIANSNRPEKPDIGFINQALHRIYLKRWYEL